MIRRFRINDWPNGSDGIEICGRLRIGWMAMHLQFMESFWSVRKLKRPHSYQIRIGRFAIAYSKYPGRNDLLAKAIKP